MDQRIRFTKSRDGTRLAYAEAGAGEPLVKTGNWLSHLEYDWDSPVWSHWFRYLTSGTGSSVTTRALRPVGLGRNGPDTGRARGRPRGGGRRGTTPALSAARISQGGVVAIEYAVRHPDRVSHLILYGSFGRGWFCSGPRTAQQARSVLGLIELAGARTTRPSAACSPNCSCPRNRRAATVV